MAGIGICGHGHDEMQDAGTHVEVICIPCGPHLPGCAFRRLCGQILSAETLVALLQLCSCQVESVCLSQFWEGAAAAANEATDSITCVQLSICNKGGRDSACSLGCCPFICGHLWVS